MSDVNDEFSSHDTTDVSRRTMLKRGAVVGGSLLWAAPLVQTVASPAFAQGSAPAGGQGTISGRVRNASTGNPISGALVTVDGTGQTGTSDVNGDYTILNVPAGPQNLTASRSGFSNSTASVVVPPDGNVVQDFNLSQLGAVRVVLAWGAQPSDLDLHMSGPDGAGDRFHVAYYDPTPVPHASLDRDDTSSFGPETITVTITPAPGGGYVPGEYRAWVHNFSTSPEFDVSSATVRLFDAATERGVYSVGDATGSPVHDLWHVVNFTLASDGTMSPITPVQTFVPGNSSTQL
ncbi:MAG TPA: carboxypeptidase regulatory-like domain-containing protein [Mycobacteriales bacterium]|nr:carboxypeptidase regulatory-like domain-containing protein [Mycobacteriales bacterium]